MIELIELVLREQIGGLGQKDLILGPQTELQKRGKGEGEGQHFSSRLSETMRLQYA